MDTRAFDAGVVLSALPQLLEFLDITLLVGISSIVLGSLLGGVLAWAKLSQHKILNYLYYALHTIHCNAVHCILWSACLGGGGF